LTGSNSYKQNSVLHVLYQTVCILMLWAASENS